MRWQTAWIPIDELTVISQTMIIVIGITPTRSTDDEIAESAHQLNEIRAREIAVRFGMETVLRSLEVGGEAVISRLAMAARRSDLEKITRQREMGIIEHPPLNEKDQNLRMRRKPNVTAARKLGTTNAIALRHSQFAGTHPKIDRRV